MTGRVVRLAKPDAEVFAPFGRFVTGPAEAGTRSFYSDSLHVRPDMSAPVLHVNNVEPSTLPIEVAGVEKHPHAAQCFLPLDVSRYVAMVMPSDEAGLPRPEGAVAFLMPGTVGIIYNPGVWHLGATVLDRAGHFTVLMWRGGRVQDDVFRAIPPLIVTDT